MEYFVTGGTGFLGGHVTQQLVADGHDVVALARSPADADDLRDLGVDVVQGDVTDRETLREPMSGVDGVFHVAAMYRLGVDDPATMRDVNVEGTRNVLDLVAALDLPKAVYTSTLAVNSDTNGELVDESYRFEGTHLSAYDRTKAEAHDVAMALAADGVPIVTVMPGAIYGPGDTSQLGGIWRDYLRGEFPAVPRRTAWCFSHVDDAARAHLLAMERGEPDEAYIVAGHPMTLVEVLSVAEELTGIPAPRSVSPAWFRLASRLAGLLERAVTLPPDYRAEPLRVLGGATYLGDDRKAREELGVEHRSFEAGFAEALDAMAREEEVDVTVDRP
ncbi:NAD-dependent epimerase/dehydratase [Salinarchaeum sp. Harcht-Bsk1]|uniref:NAD-dependent epimerase/dehydratase family protein n=1 Tax=Salinarchaeum sp. Harcht-Bsk1 TaxID=1333523 RepID=UPI0003423371|nr:NAD-dependent epimerase/dehydratase family protein [Salinarchaeum sp. Harcht-Bsk1]AGN01632.1 NAD-dependent epimerase/dehydratase [Salinarchaeum sp. Harcht-Bsk1]